LTILQLSFGCVKGNLKLGTRGACGNKPTIDASQHEKAAPGDPKLKSSLCFAIEQTRFALGQVSRLRTG
jgi:hypothetical protein